jgi:hypothetical protein
MCSQAATVVYLSVLFLLQFMHAQGECFLMRRNRCNCIGVFDLMHTSRGPMSLSLAPCGCPFGEQILNVCMYL